MTPLVMAGGPLAALAIPTPPATRAVAATPAMAAAVRRAFLSVRLLDMAVSPRSQWGGFRAAPLPAGRCNGRPAPDEACNGRPAPDEACNGRPAPGKASPIKI